MSVRHPIPCCRSRRGPCNAVVEGVGEHRPDVLLQVRQVVVVERLQQLPATNFGRSSCVGKKTSKLILPVLSFCAASCEVVEGSHLDLDAELLGEPFEHRRVYGPPSCRRAEGLPRARAQTRSSGCRRTAAARPGSPWSRSRARGRTAPGTLPQPASNPPATAVPAISPSISRRDIGRRQGDLSSGGMPSLSASSWGVRPRPYPSAASSSRLAPPCSSLSPSASKPNSLAAAPRHLVGQLRLPQGRRKAPGARGRPLARRGKSRSARGRKARTRRTLALPYHLGDGVAPAAFQRLALAGRLLVA